jgi:hypothetical protein
MLALMRDSQVPLDDRLDMAAAAAPFVHARPQPPGNGRPHPMELRAREAKAAVQKSGGGGECGDGKGHGPCIGQKNSTLQPAAPEGEENPALQPAAPDGNENPTLQSITPDRDESPVLQPAPAGGHENRPLEPVPAGGQEQSTLRPGLPGADQKAERASGGGKPATLTTVAAEPSGSCDISPMDFLLAVMTDPEATPRQRMRAAQVAARYTHRLPENSPHIVEDEFGFKIDPVVAKTIRDVEKKCFSFPTGYKPTRDQLDKNETAHAWFRELIEPIGCPDTYIESDLENDKKRLSELSERRRSKSKFTPEEDAEEAYLVARTESYRRTPQHRASDRIAKLELRRAGYIPLSAAEQREFDDLRAQFPAVAQRLAKVDWTAKLPMTIDMIKKGLDAKKRGIEISDAELRKSYIEDMRRQEAWLTANGRGRTYSLPIDKETVALMKEDERLWQESERLNKQSS